MQTKKKVWLVSGIAALVFVTAAALLVYFFGTARVFFYTPDGVSSHKMLKGTELVLEAPAPVKGYTFIGWENEWGGLEQRGSIKLYEDTYYSAVYSVALNAEEHEPYLFPDEYGFFRPNQPMTRGDAALMLYTLLSVDVGGKDNYADIPANAPYRKATAALKTLNICDGSRFHPEETLSKYELLQMLTAFFPPVHEEAEFADIDRQSVCYEDFCTAASYGWIESGPNVRAEPDRLMTRLDVAMIMNRALQRCADNESRISTMGYVLDMSPWDDDYADFAEAVLPHSYDKSEGGERWTEIKAGPQAPSGFYLAGTELYYVTSNGYVLKDFSVNGFDFDENGRYTCGMPELDELVQQVLSEIITEDMDALERLETAYYYTVKNFSYLKGQIHEKGDISWYNDAALFMLENGCGNCYGFAATFCHLAKAMGFDAVVYSGTIASAASPHGWVEIDIDGETYIFDPEMEMAYAVNRGQKIDMYMMTYAEAAMWSYSR